MNYLNILTGDVDDLKAAFLLLEGPSMEHDFTSDHPESFGCVHKNFGRHRQKRIDDLREEASRRPGEARAIEEEIAEFDTHHGSLTYVVYGTGGLHRFFVRSNGDIEFSTHHAPRFSLAGGDCWQDAKDLGFIVRELEQAA